MRSFITTILSAILFAGLLPAQSTQTRPTVIALPLQAGPGLKSDEADLGYAVQNVIENVLLVHGGLDYQPIVDQQQYLFPSADDLQAWVRGNTGTREPAVDAIDADLVFRGRVERKGNALWSEVALWDRRSNKWIRRDLAIDLPGLVAFRKGIVDILSDAFLAPDSKQTEAILWKEEVTLPAFRLLATGIGGDLRVSGYADAGNFPSAAPLRDALKLCPHSYLLQNQEGWMEHRNQRYSAAQASFTRAIEIDPSGVDALDGMMDVSLRARRQSEAESMARRKAEVRGESAAIQIAELHQRVALLAWSREEFKDAVREFEVALQALQDCNDQTRKMRLLNDLGDAYYDMIQYDSAITYYQRALTVEREINDQRAELDTLYDIGEVYLGQTKYEMAIECFERMSTVAKELGDGAGQESALYDLGNAYEGLSRFDYAIEYYKESLTIARERKDASREAEILGSLGDVYRHEGQFEKAIRSFEQSLAIAREIDDRELEASTAGGLSLVYGDLGQHYQAFGYQKRSLRIERKVKNQEGEATALNNLGTFYYAVHQNSKAINSLEKALKIEQKVNDRQGEAATLNNLGVLYGDAGKHAEEVKLLKLALALRREFRDRAGEANTLHNLGSAYREIKEFEEAIQYYEQALSIEDEIKYRMGEANTQDSLMTMNSELGQHRLAIFYGKRAVNTCQSIRSDIRELSSDIQKSYLESNAETYRKLAELLAGEGRIAEAEQVLRLLKDEEYSEYLRDAAAKSAELLPLTTHEKTVQIRYDELSSSVASLGERLDVLSKKGQAGRSAEENAEWKELNQKREEATRRFNDFLKGLHKEFAGQEDEAVRLNEIASGRSIMSTLSELGPGAVAVYTLTAKDHYVVFLFTPNAQISKEYPIGSAELGQKIADFRAVLLSRGNPLPLAQELYRIVVGPIEKELQGANAKTIMWSLDGSLRYLPIAALHDGQEYMLERYQNVVFQPNRPLHTAAAAKWNALALGVSKAHQTEALRFSALVNVPLELRAIVKDDANRDGALPGMTKLDEQFTWDATLDELERRSHTVVHIASHFNFQAGDDTASVLLLGDGNTMSLKKLKDQTNLFDKVDLLTLSACNTAMTGGDGKEVDGFAIVAQDEGANSVLATLWSVGDQSTSDLMREFYELHESSPTMTKAEALRQAQLALLHGDIIALPDPKPARTGDDQVATADATQRSAWVAGSEKTVQGPVSNLGYTHPYYWAPFILMGNWK